MRKKLTLLSLFLILSLILAACSRGAAPEEAAVEEAQPAAAEEQAQEEAPAPAAEEAKVEVGKAIEAGETATEEEEVTVSEFNEAPMLAEMVAAGELPPVDERLPVDVQVVTPVEGVGKYGGTWYNVAPNDDLSEIKMILYDPPIRWKPDYTGYEPGLAKEFSWSDDGTQVTLKFREGVKWSDGEPFTMDDLKFWWEDLALNDDYKVVQPPWWGFKSDGSPMDVEFPDDYTMVMTWDQPQWITPYILAQGFWEWEPLHKPRHYLEQFHPNYTDGATYEDLEQKSKWWQNPDHPTLFAWHVESFTPAERAILVRNPYYWKVDTEGNQLPYIDRLNISIVPEEEVRILEASQGKYTASFRATQDPTQIPFLREHAEENNYIVKTSWVNGAGGWPCWLINQDFVDDSIDNWEEIQGVLRDVNFRKGISHAMNRERLIEVAWGGIGTPQQATISPQAWHFASPEGQEVFKRWQQADAEYDVDLANQLLDAAGLLDADGDGFRDLPSGAPFTLIMDLGDWGGRRVPTDGTESFAGDLEAVGIKTLINSLFDTPDWDLRQTQGLYMLRNCHASEVDIWTYPDWIFPLRDNRAWPMEGKWRQTGGEEGIEPEPGSPAARLQAIYDRGLAEPDINKRHELVWEAIDIHIEDGPFTLGAAGDQPMPVILSKNFRGVQEVGVLGPWAPGSPGNTHPEQYWIDE